MQVRYRQHAPSPILRAIGRAETQRAARIGQLTRFANLEGLMPKPRAAMCDAAQETLRPGATNPMQVQAPRQSH